MVHRNVYSVHYREHQNAKEQFVCVIASSVWEAYDKATYEAIPAIIGSVPYSSWVDNVTYKNGNVHYFCNHEGHAY